MKEEALFKGLLKCPICQSNMGRIIENKVNSKYLCNGYRKGKCDRRIIISQNDILWLVERNRGQIDDSKFELTNEYMKSIINKIEVEEDGHFTIYYKDGTQSIYSPNIIEC